MRDTQRETRNNLHALNVFAQLHVTQRWTSSLSPAGPVRVPPSGGPLSSASAVLTNRLSVEVLWRSGRRSFITNLEPNCLVEVEEAAAVPAKAGTTSGPVRSPAFRPSVLFEDLSSLLNHTHHQEPYNDWARQPLLSRRLSQLGPGVSWFDLDGDGWDDLVIAGGQGGQLGAYRNDGRGGFKPFPDAPFNQAVTRDQTAVLGWRRPDGKAVLLAGSSNYRDAMAAGSVARSYDLSARTVEDVLPGQASSTGPLALADVDGDGELDLFVGGRAVPGRHPEPATSLLFRGRGGQWAADAPNSQTLTNSGLVSGAVFTDLDGDGWPDLVLACEWGPIRIFRNDHGKLSAWDWKLTFQPSGLSPQVSGLRSQPSALRDLTGWWNGVAAGDLNGDGRLDLVACNWGRNSFAQRYLARPLVILFGDINQDGQVHGVEAVHDPVMRKLVPWTRWNKLAVVFPFLQARIRGYDDFSVLGLEEIFADQYPRLQRLEAATLDSVTLLNRGDHFQVMPLPLEAQLAPAFAACVADFHGQGREDLFLSQNFFDVDQVTARYDAGRGLLLRGDGRGGFTPVPGQESGLLIYGEQRGAAVSDYDGDGRADLVVSQNGAQTKLYRNVGATPGLRVRLKGPAGNPHGVGAMLRLGDGGGRWGPAREIHAGSGYWSQDSVVQVMAAPFGVKQLKVRWPGGRETVQEVPPGARQVEAKTP